MMMDLNDDDDDGADDDIDDDDGDDDDDDCDDDHDAWPRAWMTMMTGLNDDDDDGADDDTDDNDGDTRTTSCGVYHSNVTHGRLHTLGHTQPCEIHWGSQLLQMQRTWKSKQKSRLLSESCTSADST